LTILEPIVCWSLDERSI